jgi:hypothetical protein
MPTTYTVQDSVDIVRKFIKDAPTSLIDVRLADYVNNIIFCAYPWRWTIKSLTPIVLTDNVQDITLAAADLPTDAAGLYRLIRARIVRTDTTPDETYDELKITEFIPPDTQKAGWPRIGLISFVEATSKLRLQRPPEITSPVVLQLEGEYQRNPAKITALSNSLIYPDQYFQVFVEGMLWQAYRYFGDSRAGSIVMVKGVPQYTGQYGVFMSHLFAMQVAEDHANGDPFRFPDEPLGVGRHGGRFLVA